MKRAVFALAIAVGLAIGTAIPTSAIGETQVTLNCSDGTSTALIVDTHTLAGLTQAVQAMIEYPAGLTCSLVQNPLGALFGGVALASPGQRPFIVGGGRWQVPCALIIGNGGQGVAEGGTFARAPGAMLSLRGGQLEETFWVNIAVNVHQRDDLTFFGTLNETIPANQFCTGFGEVGESHFTSKATCLELVSVNLEPPKAYVTSRVTQTSGAFPAGPSGSVVVSHFVHFGFQDNENPPGQNPTVGAPTTDMLAGPPATPEGTQTPPDCNALEWDPIFHLGAFDGTKQYGNISVHR